MSEFITAARYALTGIVVGSVVSAGGDVVFEYAMNAMGPMPSQTSPGASYGRGLFALVVGSSIVAGSLLVGDKLVEAINMGAEDPLFRVIYYTTAIVGSRTASQAAGLSRSVITRFAPSMSGGSAPSAPAPKGTSTCSSGTCSGN